MAKIRLVVLDIDGTLLDDEKRIPERNLDALRRAREVGILIAIASGRMLPTIEPIEARLGIDTVIISYNGGKVVGPRAEGRKEISHSPVPADLAGAFIDVSRDRGLLLNYYAGDKLYAEDGGERPRFREIYSSRTGSVYHLVDLDELRGVPPTKLILLADPPERDRLLDDLSPRFQGLWLSRSDPEYLEITRAGVNKGSALPALADYFGLSRHEILAVGDADNDNEMLAAAGIGVAVRNARESTKRIADHVTRATNNEGAVGEVIDTLVLPNA
jgi:Cof subfamily protein (haloacid dehalogenase superfamily)